MKNSFHTFTFASFSSNSEFSIFVNFPESKSSQQRKETGVSWASLQKTIQQIFQKVSVGCFAPLTSWTSTVSLHNTSSFHCLLGCKFEFAVKSTRGSYDSTATKVVPLPVLFHSHPCSICYLHVSSWPLLHKCISKFRINLNNTRSWAWHDTLVKMEREICEYKERYQLKYFSKAERRPVRTFPPQASSLVQVTWLILGRNQSWFSNLVFFPEHYNGESLLDNMSPQSPSR